MIGTFPPERARPLWDRWARYEYQYGDLEAAQKLEKRIAEVYPNGIPLFSEYPFLLRISYAYTHTQILLSNDSRNGTFI